MNTAIETVGASFKHILERSGCSTLHSIGDVLDLSTVSHPGDYTRGVDDELYLTRLLEYENRLTEMFLLNQVRGFCIYDKTSFPSSFLIAMERAHPTVVVSS